MDGAATIILDFLSYGEPERKRCAVAQDESRRCIDLHGYLLFYRSKIGPHFNCDFQNFYEVTARYQLIQIICKGWHLVQLKFLDFIEN